MIAHTDARTGHSRALNAHLGCNGRLDEARVRIDGAVRPLAAERVPPRAITLVELIQLRDWRRPNHLLRERQVELALRVIGVRLGVIGLRGTAQPAC